MNIGRPRRTIEVEPVTTPVPEAMPLPEPAAPSGEPVEPAPSEVGG